MATTAEETQTAVVATEVPVIRSLIAPAGAFGDYMAGLIRQAETRCLTADVGCEEAKRGIHSAEGADEPRLAHTWKLRLARRRREADRALMFLTALRDGYVPIPRLPAVRLEYVLGVIPPDVIDLLAEAKKEGIFEEFRVVDGRNAWDGGQPRSWSQRKTRDPILVGMIGREMFAIGWWRPE